MSGCFTTSTRTKSRLCAGPTLVVQLFAAGAVVTRQGGQHGDCMFIVKSGSVDVLIDGKSMVTLREGSLFGERALLFGHPRRTATIVAKTDLAVVVVRRRSLQQVMGEDFHDVMYRNMISSLVRTLMSKGRLPFPSTVDPESLAEAFAIREFPAQAEVVRRRRGGARTALRGGAERGGAGPQDGRQRGAGPAAGGVLRRGELLWDTNKPFRYYLKNTSTYYCNLGFLGCHRVAEGRLQRHAQDEPEAEDIPAPQGVLVPAHLGPPRSSSGRQRAGHQQEEGRGR
ncbi:unnamed protein product, partial [Prorocentrum cordatum]